MAITVKKENRLAYSTSVWQHLVNSARGITGAQSCRTLRQIREVSRMYKIIIMFGVNTDCLQVNRSIGGIILIQGPFDSSFGPAVCAS